MIIRATTRVAPTVMELLKNLNPEQTKAVTHGDGPLLIIAGAGTGKTTVITQRLAWLIDQKKARSDEILALTFTDKAAGELEERVDKLLPYGYLDLWVSTFHAFCERILKQHAIDIGLPNDFKLLNQTAQWMLVKKNLDKFNLDFYRPLGNPTKFIHALVRHFSRAKDEDISPQDYLAYAEKIKLNKDQAESLGNIDHSQISEIANAYHAYQQILLDNDVLDFGDLITYTLRLFKTRPRILEQYRQQFKYLLLDEFQDTNWAQYELIKLLAAPKNNLTVVGDDDQSIYKFRGASISNIMEFKKEFPKSAEVVLTKNYRSKQNILDLTYKFIQLNNPNRLEYQLGQPQKGKKKSLKIKISKELEAQSKGKGEIAHLHFLDQDEETAAVVNKIIAMKKKDKTVEWDDFAILVRANNQAEPFMRGLSFANVPYQFLASRGLYAKPIVLDLVAYLKLLDNYHESPALYRVLKLPMFGLSDQDLIDFNYWAARKNWSLYETLRSMAVFANTKRETVAKINKILGLIEKHTSLARRESVGKVILAFLEDSGYTKHLTAKDSQENRQVLNYLNQFYKKVKQFEEENTEKTVKDFIAQINLELEAGEEGDLAANVEDGPEAVKILTVHGAKGLEFKYVFIVNLVDLRFPSIDRKDAIELPDELVKEIIPEGDIHLEEERRLFYVAMTRAKEGLFFTSAESYGGQRKKKASRFLIELNMAEGSLKRKKKKNADQLIERSKPVLAPRVVLEDLNASVPDKFSYTQIKAFETCPYQYKFAHILRVPKREKFTFSFGKTMHSTLQHFFEEMVETGGVIQQDLFGERAKKNIAPSLERLLAIYEECWLDDWYNDKEQQQQYKKKGLQILKEFYRLHKNNWPNIQFLERPFHIKLDEYTLKGTIDRIDSANGGVEIVDYKTGNPPKDEKSLEKDQLLIYQIAAEEALQEKPVLLSFYYLNDNKKFSFLGTEKEINDLKKYIIEMIAKIKDSDFPPTPNKFKCDYCDYKEICEYRMI